MAIPQVENPWSSRWGYSCVLWRNRARKFYHMTGVTERDYSEENRFVICQQLACCRRILRWLANFVVLCQNDVICAFHSPKTMELILVVFISAGMVENSQNGDSRSLILHLQLTNVLLNYAI